MADQFTGAGFARTRVLMGSAADGGVYLIDALEQDDGRVWLVPQWLELPSDGRIYPTRIILMNPLQHRRVDQDTHKYALNQPIPQGVLSGDQTAPSLGYVVIERPKIALRSVKGTPP